MKDKIHPKVNKVVFLDVTSGVEFATTSTLRSDETKKIDGADYFIIKVETSSASHPFYTGKRRSDVKNDQVAKFMAKVAKAQAKNKPTTVKQDDAEEATSVKPKTAKKTTKKAKK